MELARITAEDVREEFRRFKRGMSPTHKLMAEWIIQNPGGTYREMGAFFGYSPAWCCTVVNSDMFKAHLGDRIKDIQVTVTQDVPERLRGLAHLAMDRMEETLTKTGDADVIVDSFDKIMHRYGYAPNAKNGAGQVVHNQNNVFYLQPDEFQRARGTFIDSHAQRPALEQKPVQEDERESLPATTEKA